MRTEFFRRFMAAWNAPLVEGEVGSAKAQVKDHLNHDLALPIVKQAKAEGIEAEAEYVEDIEDAISPVRIDIQLGMSRRFPESEWMGVYVYDDDNFKVRVTKTVADALGIEPYMDFEGLQQVLAYLPKIYAHLHTGDTERSAVMGENTD